MKLRVLLTLALSTLGTAALVGEAAATPSVLARFEKGKKAPAKPAEKPAEKKADAKKKGAKDKEEKAAPGQLKKQIALAPKGIKWGMSLEQVAKIYDKVFDEEFVPLYKKVQPGPQMEALDAELEQKKALIRRSRVDFGTTPTGYDDGDLRIEYSYRNKESLAKLTLRTGTVRYFFFFDDKLWKVYDEYKLRKGGPLGESYSEAMQILTKKLGVAPVALDADPDNGRPFPEALWTDGLSYIRAVDRGPMMAVSYLDKSVQDNLAEYRKAKAENVNGVDSDVARVTRPEEEKPKDPPKDKPKKKK